MTQEQAQEILATVNGKLEMKRLEAVNLLFREIDELKMMEEDAQQYALKCRKELEALQQRSCDGCIRLPFILIELAKRDGGKCGTCKRFVKDHYELEPKEQ